ncbi:MAG: GTP-sensing transcriptional pleiotropic repressor CodY [Pelotomaculum sp. PtaB.Bin104]|nr:MAG: GTP-sensing transcriptional pleiotropic repressor CodY [Pelotomaculum sp. PtaB.Bin104]
MKESIKELLEKTREMNKMILSELHTDVDFSAVAEVLSKNINASVYVLDIQGNVLGYTYVGDWECEIMREIVESDGVFPADYNEKLLKHSETTPNLGQKRGECVYRQEACRFNNKITTIIPISGTDARVGTLIMSRFGEEFTDADLVLGEYGATLVAMKFSRAKTKKLQEEARMRATVQIALETLSYSELDAIQHIFEQLDGDEGLLVASKIADRVGITRSVIVNALRKFESAGVIESKSLGMKGTYIRVLNNYLLEELDKLTKSKKN